MASFSKIVKDAIWDSDLVIIVLDARFIEETRNKDIEWRLSRGRKKIIYAINKSDLLTKSFTGMKLDLKHPYIFVSAKHNLGTTKLRSMIKGNEKRPLMVGVLGYPNTGKSSLINVLKQRRSARTSPTPGLTKGLQKIKISKGIYLLDTPGVFPRRERDDFKHSLINAKDPNRIEDPDIVAAKIIELIIKKDKKILESAYNIKLNSDDPYEILEEIAINCNWLLKGNLPNVNLAARRIITDWQRGKLLLD